MNRKRLALIVFCIFCIFATLVMCSRADARELKLSSAANVMVFMTDSADHITGKAGLTLTITASADGGAFGGIAPSVTDRGSGWYNLALTTSHTGTIGDLALHITSTGADPSDLKLTIVANIESDTYTALGSPMQAGTKVVLHATQTDYAPAKAGDAMTLTSPYDPAKAAASQASVTALGSPMQAGTKVVLHATQTDYAPAKAGDAMTLTSPYDPAKAAASQASVTALGSPMQAGTKVVLHATQTDYAPAKAGDAMTLTSPYDPAKAAASQSSVDALAAQTGTDVTLAASQPNYAPAKAGDAMTLTGGERTSVATSVWTYGTRKITDPSLNEGDSLLTVLNDKPALLPDNSGISGIKEQTDQLVFSGGRVDANASLDSDAVADAIWGKALPGAYADGTAGAIMGGLQSTTAIIEFQSNSILSAQADIPGNVWDALSADHTADGTIGKIISNMGTLADPWAAQIPGSYPPGSAGQIMGTPLTPQISLPILEGSAYSEIAIQNKEITIVRKNSVTIPILVRGGDYTSWAAWFGAKTKLADTQYVISPRQCDNLVYDIKANSTTGTCSLSTADTTITPGSIVAEVQLRSGDNAVTPLRFNIMVLKGVFD